MSTRPLHRPALETPSRYGGIDSLGLGVPGIRVHGLTYWEAKVRWMCGEQLSTEVLTWVGVDGANRPRSGGWRQPMALPAWTPSDGYEEEHDSAEYAARLLLSPESVRRLEAPEGEGAGR